RAENATETRKFRGREPLLGKAQHAALAERPQDLLEVAVRDRLGQIHPLDGGAQRLTAGVDLHVVPGLSVDMRARCLDDRRPLRQLRFDERGSLLRRAARRRIDAGLLQALEHRRIVERFVYGLAEAVDDRLRRVRGSEDCVPSIALEALQSLLLQRRQLLYSPATPPTPAPARSAARAGPAYGPPCPRRWRGSRPIAPAAARLGSRRTPSKSDRRPNPTSSAQTRDRAHARH